MSTRTDYVRVSKLRPGDDVEYDIYRYTVRQVRQVDRRTVIVTFTNGLSVTVRPGTWFGLWRGRR